MSEVPGDVANTLADLIAAQSDATTPRALGCALLREDRHAGVLGAGEVANSGRRGTS